MECVGLRWYKCDFHLHTMSSKCYLKQDKPEEWAKAVKESGLQCVAITDHNDYRGIASVKAACEAEGIIVFPGVELSCSDSKIHVLVIFDRNCDEETVHEFLSSVEVFQASLGDSGKTCKGSIEEVCIKAKKQGALVIAAHIDEFSGINQLSYDNLKSILGGEYIAAVQVVNADVWERIICKELTFEEASKELSEKYREDVSVDMVKSWYKTFDLTKKSGLPMLMFSDNPSAEGESTHGLWGIGRTFTWMKMAENPNLESVRQTLLSPEMRVKNCFEDRNKPDQEPDLWLRSIKLCNTLLNEKEFEVSFNPQLNTIIGGRGSGKSAIVRTLAGGLCSFDGENLDKIREEQKDFYKIPSRDKKGVFKNDSKVEVFLERAGSAYKILISNIKSMNEQKRQLFIYDDGDWKEILDVNYLDFFKVQIYTQKQIYELALDSVSLLSLMDEDVPDLAKKKDERDSLLSQVIAKKIEIWNIEKVVGEKSKVNTELKDIESQISKYEKTGISQALKKKQKYDSQKNEIEKYISSKKERLAELANAINVGFAPYGEIDVDDSDINDLIINNEKLFQSRCAAINQIVAKVEEDIDLLNKEISNSGWKKGYDDVTKEYDEARKKLDEVGVDSLKLDDLILKKKQKEIELDSIKNSESSLVGLNTELNVLVEQYENVLNEISKLRSDFIADVIGKGSNVKFEIQRNRNRQAFIQGMKNCLNRDNNTIDDDINKLADIFFGKSGKEKFRDIIEKMRGGEKGQYSARLRTAVSEIEQETYARLISFQPDDDLKVSYKPEGHKSFIPLSNASAGQKTTAILTFLLAYGEKPLLLDQPEDDLDNKLVYDLIVSRLKTAKAKRQIIVVTHNANIPVNADAEYIVSMNSETEEIETKHSGTMDDEKIRREICDVMEGTKYAFEMRAKKYHFKIIE